MAERRQGGVLQAREAGVRRHRAGAREEEATPTAPRAWPWACNGCQHRRRRGCNRRFKCEHSAARSQALADGLLSEVRRGLQEGVRLRAGRGDDPL